MKLLIALCVAAAAAQPVLNPTIRLKKPETNTTVNIEWDGYQLTIPQHTDKIIADLKNLAAKTPYLVEDPNRDPPGAPNRGAPSVTEGAWEAKLRASRQSFALAYNVYAW